jgi:hypothetical protein
MNTKRDGRNPLPPTATVPLPPRPANGPEAYAPRGHNSFLAPMHEDVGRVMQNIIDLQTDVMRLRKENQEWERRALLAEGKVFELKQEIQDIKDINNKETLQLKGRHNDELAVMQKDLDFYKTRDAVVQTKLSIGAKHFLDCIQAVDEKTKQHEGQVLQAVEHEVSRIMTEFDQTGER